MICVPMMVLLEIKFINCSQFSAQRSYRLHHHKRRGVPDKAVTTECAQLKLLQSNPWIPPILGLAKKRRYSEVIYNIQNPYLGLENVWQYWEGGGIGRAVLRWTTVPQSVLSPPTLALWYYSNWATWVTTKVACSKCKLRLAFGFIYMIFSKLK